MNITIINGIHVLKPTDGLKITNADRTFYSDEVWLGKEDSPENYTEVEWTEDDPINSEETV